MQYLLEESLDILQSEQCDLLRYKLILLSSLIISHKLSINNSIFIAVCTVAYMQSGRKHVHCISHNEHAVVVDW